MPNVVSQAPRGLARELLQWLVQSFMPLHPDAIQVDTLDVTTLSATSIELGHASDTTLTRLSAGVVGVEGTALLKSGGALGTPASGTLTNVTGLPIATGVSGLGAGVAGMLATTYLAKLPSGATSTITLGTPSGTTQTISVQLKNAAGTNLSQETMFLLRFATTAAGTTPEGFDYTDYSSFLDSMVVPTTAGMTVNTEVGGNVTYPVSWLLCVTNASGVWATTADNNGGVADVTTFLLAELPDGKAVSTETAVSN